MLEIWLKFMNKLTVLFVIAATFGCSKAPVAVQQNANVNAPEAPRSERAQTVIAHSSENQPAPMPSDSAAGQAPSKWSQGGTPIDTTKFDQAIAAAEKDVKAKPGDEAAKKALSQAYFQRAVELTDARQYASALGDYRRAVKYDPNNEEAKNWVDQIVMIYDSMKKSYPKEGEEPPPLPFNK